MSSTHWPICAMLVTLAMGSQTLAAEHHTLARAGGPDIDWYLDRQGAPRRQGILVLAQGSGCGSVSTNRNIAAAKQIRPDAAVLTVEKWGVEPGAVQNGPDDCSPAFWSNHTVSQRVRDYRAVIEHLNAEPWWNGELILFGGSEGGAVVQILAAEVDASAAVVFSSATGIPFSEAFVEVVPPPVAAEAKSVFDRIRQEPLSAERWGGNSYRWWADIIDRPLWKYALDAKGPILAVQGAKDRSNPVGSARAFRDAFAAHGQRNLTYWEYPDYDHGMVDGEGVSHLPQVFSRIAEWLDQKLGTPSHASDR